MLFPADIVAALKRRWRLELAILVIVLAAVLVWTALSPRVYIANASLLFDQRIDPVQDAQVGEDTVAALLETQTDVLQSTAIAAAVARNEKLSSDPTTIDNWQRATGGTGDINTWMGRQLLSGLSVVPERASRVLTVQYRAGDPNFAAAMANAFATTYLDTRLRLQTDPARTYSRWFEERTREVRSALEQAQARLTAFQRRTGIVDVGAVNAESNRLNELSTQLTGAEAASADINARAGSSAAQSVDVQSSGVVQGLRSQIAGKTAEVSQLATQLGPNHPQRQAVEAELNALRNRLALEISTVTRSVQVASGSANTKEATLRQSLNAQRGRMLGLAGDRNQLDVLQRDVDSARTAYDLVTQKLSTMRLQSEVPSTNVRQLDTATPPLLPAQPNVPLRILLGVVLGTLLAMGVGTALELWRPRVRTASGLVNSVGLPVLVRIDFTQSQAGRLLGAGGVE
jgi:succinoglycan biosynthesis transport protein ExoP